MPQRGVHTLEDIRLRCRICDITGCWIWAMAIRDGDPAVSVAVDGGHYVMGGRRAALTVQAGTRLPRSVCAVAMCPNKLCVAPHHTRQGTQAEALKAASEMFNSFRSLASQAARVKGAKKRRKLTDEQVQYLRTSGVSLAQASIELGMSEGSLTRARAGKTYAPTGFSVFTWRPVPSHDRTRSDEGKPRASTSSAGRKHSEKTPRNRVAANDEGSIAA